MKKFLAIAMILPLLLAWSFNKNSTQDLLAMINGTVIAMGLVKDQYPVNKFGTTTNADDGIATDVWAYANPTDDQDIFVSPTAARIHTIVSSSTDDDGAPVGDGCRTLQVSYLPDWDTKETTEIVTMNGTTSVGMLASAVHINRMECITYGDTSPNVGNITATATTDSTVSAYIAAGLGQTQMAILGVPSTQTLYIDRFFANLRKNASAEVDVFMKWNGYVETSLVPFVTKHAFGLQGAGTSAFPIPFSVPKKFVGPGILKLQVNSTAADVVVSGGFEGFLRDN